MPLYLDTRGHKPLAIGICGRCKIKFPLDELHSDPNYPGVYVCDYDLDEFDPWRLPARETENISLDHPRPDAPIQVGPEFIPINQMEAALSSQDAAGDPVAATNPDFISVGSTPVSQLNPSVAWTPNTPYNVGDQVTDGNPVGPAAVGLLYWVFTCIVAGTSGALAPEWTTNTGTEITDSTVIWLNTGLYLP